MHIQTGYANKMTNHHNSGTITQLFVVLCFLLCSTTAGYFVNFRVVVSTAVVSFLSFFDRRVANDTILMRLLQTEKAGPQDTRGILKRSLISTVRPTVHPNPSQNRSFTKTLFKLGLFENAGLAFKLEPKTF